MNGLDLAIGRGVRRLGLPVTSLYHLFRVRRILAHPVSYIRRRRAHPPVRQTPRREPRVTLTCQYTPCPNLETETWRYDRDGAVLVRFPDERYADNPLKRALLRDVV